MKNSSRNQEFDEVTSQERADIEEGLRSLATERRYTMEEVYEACGLSPLRARGINTALETTPHDNEPLSDEDRRRLCDGQEFFAQGKGISMEDVLAELGLKPDDFPVTR